MAQKKFLSKLSIILSCILVLLIAASVAGCGKDGTTTDGSSSTLEPIAQKTVKVCVIAGEDRQDFTLETEAEFLREALEEENLIKGDESAYGLFVTEVNGIKADDSKRQWWCITKGGETVMTGVDTTPIADGDTFELTLSTY